MPVPITRRLLPSPSIVASWCWHGRRPRQPLLRPKAFDAAALEAWSARTAGVDDHWTHAYSGTVYDVPGGKVLATVDGWRSRAPGGARPSAWYVVRRAISSVPRAGSGEILARYPTCDRAAPVPVLSIVRFALRGDRASSPVASPACAARRARSPCPSSWARRAPGRRLGVPARALAAGSAT